MSSFLERLLSRIPFFLLNDQTGNEREKEGHVQRLFRLHLASRGSSIPYLRWKRLLLRRSMTAKAAEMETANRMPTITVIANIQNAVDSVKTMPVMRIAFLSLVLPTSCKGSISFFLLRKDVEQCALSSARCMLKTTALIVFQTENLDGTA